MGLKPSPTPASARLSRKRMDDIDHEIIRLDIIRQEKKERRSEVMRLLDQISCCRLSTGERARMEVEKLAEERGVDFLGCYESEVYLAICREVLAKWRTINNFKVGDK